MEGSPFPSLSTQQVADFFFATMSCYDLKTTKSFVETHHPDLNVYQEPFTPLIYAVDKNDIQLAKYLISAGADVNLSTPDPSHPNTAFQMALDRGPPYAEMAQLLLEMNADHTSLDREHNNALLKAFKTYNWKIVCYLLNHQKYCDPKAKNAQGESVMDLIQYLSERTNLPEDLPLELYDSAMWVGQNPKLISVILQWSCGNIPQKD